LERFPEVRKTLNQPKFGDFRDRKGVFMAKIERIMPKSSGRKLVFFTVATAALAALTFAIYIDATTFSLKVKINPKNGGTVWSDKTQRYKKAGTAIT